MKSRSRSRREPNPAREASCPRPRSRRKWPGCAAPCPASPLSPLRRITTSIPLRIWPSSSTICAGSAPPRAFRSSSPRKAVWVPWPWVWQRQEPTASSFPATTAAPEPPRFPPYATADQRGNSAWQRHTARSLPAVCATESGFRLTAVCAAGATSSSRRFSARTNSDSARLCW